MEQFLSTFLLFIIYSILGWIVETLYCVIYYHKLSDRGFLIGPCCPIYGVAAITITFFLNKYHNDYLAIFIMSVVIGSIVEYIVSFLLEKIFHARWWDYSNKMFNINGRINLRYSVYFGILGIIIIQFSNPFITKYLNLLPNISLYSISILCLIIFTIDAITSTIITFKLNKTADMLKKDCSNEFNSKIREILTEKSILYKRINLAFPNYHILPKKNKISKK